MKKIIDITFKEPYKILCYFNTGEKRMLNLKKILDPQQKYAKKVFDDNVFYRAKVGDFGEIYWDNLAEIKDLDGKYISCVYDISPELIYSNSIPVKEYTTK